VIVFWSKALISGLLVAIAATIARRQPALGSLIVSLPLVSVLTMIWLWREGTTNEAMANYVGGTFWFFLPSMPMFLIIPALLRRGITFWPALGIGCAVTIALYLMMIAVAARFSFRIDA
jgi:glycopeptide antibiotics resistance protein